MQQQLNELRESLNTLRQALGVAPSVDATRRKSQQVLDAITRHGLRIEAADGGDKMRVFGKPGVDFTCRSLADIDLSALETKVDRPTGVVFQSIK